MKKQKKGGDAELMLVLYVPDGPDMIKYAHPEMIRSGFDMNRPIIPAYAVGEDDMPQPGSGMYIMQKIKAGGNS